MYWRVNDIPELHSVPGAQRRQLWGEAVTRSFSVRYLLVRLATTMLGGVAFAGLAYPWWSTSPACLVFGLLGVFCAGAVFEFAVAQPRAQRWLREHAGELDRYLA